ncbi:hypothetical protein ACA910_010752 [Epithemia clementina (nom. ined.)]
MRILAICLLFVSIARSVAYQPLSGVVVQNARKSGPSSIDIGEWLSTGKSLFVFGTYAADFNAIEYGQRLRYYWPKLQDEKAFDKCAFLLSCQPDAAVALADYVDLPASIELYVDNTGEAARKFGVCRGWLCDNQDVNPFLKLFGMLWGLGAWATLPAVIGGYIGNPFVGQPWITDALAVGQAKGRWPDNALERNESDGTIVNKFDELPLVGKWPRRPLELATLRLQSMLGISLANWKDLAPDEEALENGVLTQLGGCIATYQDQPIFEYRDPGICAVVNFEDFLKKVP